MSEEPDSNIETTNTDIAHVANGELDATGVVGAINILDECDSTFATWLASGRWTAYMRWSGLYKVLISDWTTI